MHTNPLARALSATVVGPEITCRSLVMLPLVAKAAAPSILDYTVLDDGVATGEVEVTEVSDAGSVPELRVVNRGPKPALIVDGEELVGAKQNRVVNLTILVAAYSTLTIPVTCVEAGRWRPRSRAFSAAPRAQYASGRAARMTQVTAGMLSSGSRRSDQGAVWEDIAGKAQRLNAASPTGAMDAIFESHAGAIDACVAACGAVDGQVGALFLVAGRVVGFDLFDAEATLRKLLPKLVRSAAVDALDEEAAGARPPQKRFPMRQLGEHFLTRVAEAPWHRTPAVGMGEDVRVATAGLTGAALAVGGEVVHAAAFAVN